MNSSLVFICGGGTGGHFFSGLALAEKILEYYPEKKIRFIGTSLGIEARTELKDPRMDKIFIAAKGLAGKNILSKIKGVFSLTKGVFQSIQLLISERPQVIVGVGGYASAPTVFAALLLKPFLGHKVFILEQNSHAGISNRLMCSLGAVGYSGFHVSGFQLVDLPLRFESQKRSEKARSYEWPPKTILILGGSQGARGLNKKWLEIVPYLVRKFPNIRVIHQTGKIDENEVQQFYQSHNIQAEVFAFSNDMPTYYERADLIVCRAGAMTVFEIMAFKRPAIFVPFPAAAEDHQYYNAMSVHSEKWVIREKDLNWQQIESLLGSDSIPLPGSQRKSLKGWKDILSEWFTS